MTTQLDDRPSTTVRDRGPERSRSRGTKLIRLIAERSAVAAVFLALWEAASRTIADPFFVSQPSRIIGRLVELTTSGVLFSEVRVTLEATLYGLLLGVVVGLTVGLLLARFQYLATVLDPFVMGLYSLPRVALAPLFIIWFGIGILSKVMMAFSLVVFVVLLNTYEGAKNVDRNLIDMIRTMNGSNRDVTRRVILPSVLPWVMAAVRISVGMALIGTVVGELIGSNSGLGHYVARAAGLFDTTGVFAGLVALMLVAALLNEFVKAIDRRLFRWRPEVKLGGP